MAKNGNIHPTRIFKTPEDLEKVWNAYKQKLSEDAFKWEKVQYVGKDGERRVDSPKLPLTYEGFKRYCWDSKVGTITHYFENSGNRYDDFSDVCSRVKNEIREDQITGGLLGFYNPSITQRLNSLSEKSDTTIREQPLFSDGE